MTRKRDGGSFKRFLWLIVFEVCKQQRQSAVPESRLAEQFVPETLSLNILEIHSSPHGAKQPLCTVLLFLIGAGNRSLLFPSVDLDGVFQRRCISCNLIDGCRFFKVEFSPNHTHFTLYCLGKTRSKPACSPRSAQAAGLTVLSFEKNSPGPGIPKVTAHSTKDPSSECYICLSG